MASRHAAKRKREVQKPQVSGGAWGRAPIVSPMKGVIYGTIYRNGHELRGLQRPCGKGRFRRAGRDELLGQPAHQLHGRGRHGFGGGRRFRCAGGGLRRVAQGRALRADRRRAGGRAGRPRNPGAQAPPDRVAGLFDCADVFLDGAHDVGLAAARLPCG